VLCGGLSCASVLPRASQARSGRRGIVAGLQPETSAWWFGGDGLCALPSANGGASAGGDVLVQVWTGELWRESRRVRSSASSPMRSAG